MMRFFLITLVFLFCLTSLAGNLISDAPKKINEYENFYIKISSVKRFKIVISNSCLKISSLDGITEKDGFYYSEKGGKINFDNFCFEGDKVEINMKSQDQEKKLKYKVQPKVEEERSFSC